MYSYSNECTSERETEQDCIYPAFPKSSQIGALWITLPGANYYQANKAYQVSLHWKKAQCPDKTERGWNSDTFSMSLGWQNCFFTDQKITCVHSSPTLRV